MKVFSLIDNLKAIYENNKTVRKNNTVLLCPGTIPKAKHMLFQGLSQDIIDEYLIDSYKNIVPPQYIEFLKYSNGGTFYMYKVQSERKVGLKTKKIEFASSGLTIFGIPRTPPYERAIDMEEPFDIRIEDLRRHKAIPKSWLGVGRYHINEIGSDTAGIEASLFIDCDSQKAYACVVDEYTIIEEWNSFDECLCNIFDREKNYKDLYLVR